MRRKNSRVVRKKSEWNLVSALLDIWQKKVLTSSNREIGIFKVPRVALFREMGFGSGN